MTIFLYRQIKHFWHLVGKKEGSRNEKQFQGFSEESQLYNVADPSRL